MRFSVDDQWRSFQTYLAAYLVGMLHPQDVLTISRRSASPSPPLVEFRCDDDGEPVGFGREDVNRVARQTVEQLRSLDGIDEPRALLLSRGGPASSVPALAEGGFMSGGGAHRQAALIARMTADIDVAGDVIQAAARAAGDRTFAVTRSGSIAAIVAAKELRKLRTWGDLFNPAPEG